jgi:hypothetical protein
VSQIAVQEALEGGFVWIRALPLNLLGRADELIE